MSYFGTAPDMGLESVTPESAIRQMEALEKDGAVHTIWTMITPFIGAICNCQPGDCLGLRTLAIDVETMCRGEQMAVINPSLCDGCGSCLEACYFDAIHSNALAGEYRAVVDSKKCFGCGLCRNSCPKDAFSMVTRG